VEASGTGKTNGGRVRFSGHCSPVSLELEDFIMREIREYNMNGTIILGVDNGYGNVKTAHRVFQTGIVKCDSEPVLTKEYIEYDGAYYIIGEGHKGFVADKQEDDDTYIMTLAAIAKELEARGLTEAKIHLAVGLPLKWVQAQRNSFKKYLTRKRYVSLKYKKISYLIEITDCTVMPQGYAAVAENLKDFKGMNMLVDIGNGTMNIMYLNNGRPIESKSWTEKLGVHQCFIRIQNEIMNRTGVKIQEEIINQFLRQGEIDASDKIQNLVKEVAEQYVKELFDKLHDYEYNEDLMRLYVMGGGAKMVEMFGKYNLSRTTFNHDICANVKGYEYFCYMMLRQKMRK
jgi:plasmid segregation protein ParM